MIETQGEPGEHPLDQVLAYRFWFSASEVDTDLVVENRSDRDALVAVIQVTPGGSTQTLAKKLVVPGGAFVVPAAELSRTTMGHVLVKTPRRLTLALAPTSSEASPLKIHADANAVFFDIFSAARQFDVDQEAHRKPVGARKGGQRVLRVLGELETAAEAAALNRKEVRSAAAEQNARRFFISYWVK